jgi:RNA polymerase sigma-70 factor (ECF subfamily)
MLIVRFSFALSRCNGFVIGRGMNRHNYMTSKQTIEKQTLLTEAHRDYAKGLTSYAFFKLHDHEMGEDMVQDTFMKTWVYLVKKGKIDLMKAFLYRILNNLIVDQYRKNKMTSLDSLLEKGYEPSTNPSERLMNMLDGKKALLLIQRLPQKYQKVMRMRYVQDLSLKEMALITGETKNTLAVQLHRGLTKLKVLYR